MNTFVNLTLILLLAAGVSTIIRILKQPLIIGYILTGIILGPYVFNIVQNTDTINLFSKLGVAILLFIVGLSLSPHVMREIGRVSIVAGIGQVVFTTLMGFFIAGILGYNKLESIYIAIALTFSSTIIILKLLTDKGDLNKLYGKISIGFLLIQDLVASIILIIISSTSGITSSIGAYYIIGFLLLKAIIVSAVILLLTLKILPKFGEFLAQSQEYLFIFSLAWSLGVASLFYKLGLSMEIGSLFAGVTLAVTPYSQEISSRMRPLRDFFVMLFFILLGTQMVFSNFQTIITPVIVFSIFILIGNPLIVIIIMNLLGYHKRTGFLSGLTMAQISEFSLILIALGVNLGYISPQILSMVTIVGVITIAGSTYLILYSEKIYQFAEKYLSILEIKKVHKESKKREVNYDAILFGYHRVGQDFVSIYKKLGINFLIIDYNPEVIKELQKTNEPYLFGDAEDIELLNEINFSKIKLIVSTIPDFDTNNLITKLIRKINKTAIIMVISENKFDTLDLYESGASYVVMPHYLGAKYAVSMISSNGLDAEKFSKDKEKHLKYLAKRHI